LLESLVDTSLLESAAPGRYRFHDLVRLYARACAERDEQPPAEREAAMSRLLDFYLATAAEVYVVERPGERMLTHLAPTTHPGLTFTDGQAASDWLFAEAGCLLACVRQQAGTTGHTLRRAVDLLLAAKDLAESGADSRQYEQAATALLLTAQQCGDTLAEGRARTVLAHVDRIGGRFAPADEHARLAIELGQSCGDIVPSCNAANIRGIIAIYQHRSEEAVDHLSHALAAFREDGNRSGEASALSNLSRVLMDTGRSAEGVRLAEQALALYQELGATWRLANGLYALGVALTHAGRYEEALARFDEALPVFRDSRQRLWEGMTHYRIADVHLCAGRPAAAAHHAEQALKLRNIGGAWRRGNILTLLGRSLDALGQPGRARACWTEALGIYEQLGASEATDVRGLLSGVVTAA
ncbi:AfsR family transcriptional regulator, partial [Streptomyces griseocarneus]